MLVNHGKQKLFVVKVSSCLWALEVRVGTYTISTPDGDSQSTVILILPVNMRVVLSTMLQDNPFQDHTRPIWICDNDNKYAYSPLFNAVQWTY